MELGKIFKKGLLEENPVFFQAIGMCPTLAVTTSIENGIGMGLATTSVLACSNVVVSIIRKIVPDKVRIPCYIVVIASFVTIVQFLLEGFLPQLNASLGIFIPLIVVNCLILARAEAFASKNNPVLSLADGVAMGLGFTVALGVISAVRELIGSGALLGMTILPEEFPRTLIMVLPPGAFFTLGFLMAFLNYLKGRGEK